MKIKEKHISTSTRRKKNIDSNRMVLLISISFIIILIIGTTFFATSFIKTKGYHNLFDFTKTVSSNFFKGLNSAPEKINIEIAPEEFARIIERRDIAIKRKVIINEEGSYVPAVITYGNKKIEVKLRLKGHMTDHVEGKKWSYRIRVKGNDHFMGMRTFSIQHPGTRGYFYEWIYHQMLKEMEIAALRYKFIHVTLNDEDLGIYAVEEHFDDELIADNGRPAGPVFRFNPNLYWVDRYNEILRDKVTAEFASYASSNLESFRGNKVLKDSLQTQYMLRGIALMEAFRRGEMSASEVFDIEKQAKFYAVMDLLGGHFSMDWSDVKFYYNPVTSRLEPVGYESCSLFPIKKIAGSYRYKKSHDISAGHYHDLLFSDPSFFRAYIREVEKISDKFGLMTFSAEMKLN
jgi:hypothetical protein